MTGSTCLLALVLLGDATPTTQPRASVELPAEIRRALEQGARQLGPITVAWSHRSQCSMTPEEAQKTLKTADWLADALANGRYEHRLSWQDGMYLGWYRQSDWPTKLNPGLDERDYSFDGKTMYIGSKQELPDGTPGATLSKVAPAVLEIDQGHSLDSQFVSTDYFNSCGLRLPVRLGDLKEKRPVRPEIIEMLQNGATLAHVESVELEGRMLTKLQIVAEDPNRRSAEKSDAQKVYDELMEKSIDSEEYIRASADAILLRRKLPKERIYIFYLDPQLNYAIRRSEEQYEGGTLLKRVDCDDFEKLPGREVYLPHRITEQAYTSPNVPTTFFKEPVVTGVIEVSEIKTEALPADQFELKYTDPETHIYERLEPGQSRHFIVDQDGVPRER